MRGTRDNGLRLVGWLAIVYALFAVTMLTLAGFVKSHYGFFCMVDDEMSIGDLFEELMRLVAMVVTTTVLAYNGWNPPFAAVSARLRCAAGLMCLRSVYAICVSPLVEPDTFMRRSVKDCAGTRFFVEVAVDLLLACFVAWAALSANRKVVVAHS